MTNLTLRPGLAPPPGLREGSDPGYRRGVFLVLLIAVVWSFSGLIFRSIEAAGDWEIIFYRSIGVVAGAALAVIWRYGRAAPKALVAIGRTGVVAALCLAAASVCFLQAIHHTTIANIAFIIAAQPFFAALLGWVLLRESVAWRTWAAAALALCGVFLMVLEGIALGGAAGNLLALLAALLSAGYAVALRGGRRADMTPAVALAGLFALIAVTPLVADFAISWRDLGLCLLQGFGISALCNSLFAVAARSVPVAELMLFSLLETVLAPLWVWLAIQETPSGVTLLGGAVILSAVMGHACLSLRRRPLPAAKPL